VRQRLIDDLSEQAQHDRLAALDAALLVLHAPGDETVGIDHARRIFDAARHPKSFVSLDGADHLLTRPGDARWAGDVVAAWASRYLPRTSAPSAPAARGPAPREASHRVDGTAVAAAVDDGTPAPPGTVVVTETGSGPFVEHVRAGRHTFVADEPTSVPGGTDTGPGPYDLLLAALGTCTAMTIRMYATRKDLPLERVSVALVQEHVHADDLTACVGGGEDCMRQFAREITLVGDLDDAQRQKLLEIANKCPVHRTLEAGAQVVTRLA
jgi:putative redox protein